MASPFRFTVFSCSFCTIIGAVLLLVFGSFTPTVIAQTANFKGGPSYITRPFDDSVSELPVGFVGHDAAQIISAIRAKFANVEKSKYETSAQYSERMKKLNTTPFLGSLKPEDKFAFVVKPDMTDYDAETSQFSIRISGFFYYDLDKNDCDLSWRSSQTDLGSYIASNAFGAKFQVARTEYRNILLALGTETPVLGSRCSGTHEIRIEPVLAQKLADKIKILIIGSLDAPFVSVDAFSYAPEAKFPHDRSFTNTLLHMNLSQVWLFDPDSGRILARWPEPTP